MKKGYGFLKPDQEGAQDLFVHYTQIVMPGDGGGFKTLEAQQRVSYQVGTNKNGPMAINVTPLD